VAILALALSLAGSASAQTVSGTGTLVCDGDGVIVLSGDFSSITASTDAGALVHNKPTKGSLLFTATKNFIKHIGTDATIYIGSGSGTASNVKGLKMTLSGANAHIEITGTGKAAVHGDGSCTNGQGKKITWKTSDQNVNIAP